MFYLQIETSEGVRSGSIYPVSIERSALGNRSRRASSNLAWGIFRILEEELTMVLVRLLDDEKFLLSLTDNDGTLQLIATDRVTKRRHTGYLYENKFEDVLEAIIGYVDKNTGRRKTFFGLGRMERSGYNSMRMDDLLLLTVGPDEVKTIQENFEVYKAKIIAERRELYGL